MRFQRRARILSFRGQPVDCGHGEFLSQEAVCVRMWSMDPAEPTCKICRAPARHIFSGFILGKYDAKYFFCDQCHFLQTEEPHWLEEAYKNPINESDTGILFRNIRLAKLITSIIYFYFRKSARFVDYAGGYGIFTRLMRDYGFDFYWKDRYADNLLAKGFAFTGQDNIELVTLFEALEHFHDPLAEFEKIFALSRNVICTTDILPSPVPKPGEWWYYCPDYGQHISFYSLKTLQYIAQKYELTLFSRGNFHLFSERKINPYALRFLLLLSKLGLSEILRRTLVSKTSGDMQLMVKMKNAMTTGPDK